MLARICEVARDGKVGLAWGGDSDFIFTHICSPTQMSLFLFKTSYKV